MKKTKELVETDDENMGRKRVKKKLTEWREECTTALKDTSVSVSFCPSSW